MEAQHDKQSSFSIDYPQIVRALITPVGAQNPLDITPEQKTDILLIPMKYFGLWDTGATTSCISQKVVDELRLVSTGISQVYTTNGVCLQETYVLNIILPNNIVFPSLVVTKGDIFGADILIGMDIITAGDSAVTSNNNTVLSYRTPASEHIDFSKQEL